MASLRKRGKVWYFRFIDADGNKVERKGATDKRVTEELGRQAENESAKVRAGLIDPRAVAQGAHENRPLSAHLADWHTYLIDKGSTQEHANLTRIIHDGCPS